MDLTPERKAFIDKKSYASLLSVYGRTMEYAVTLAAIRALEEKARGE